MTTIAAFATISNTSKKVYILSDSKITWTHEGNITHSFNDSNKLFPFINSGDVLAYAGESTFNLSTLSKIKNQLEFSYHFKTSVDPNYKKNLILTFLNNSIKDYPKSTLLRTSIILYFTAVNNNIYGFKFYIDSTDKFISVPINIPVRTGFIISEGSGEIAFQNLLPDYIREYGNTGYSIFFAFVNHVKSNIDPKTGGAPQIVQLDSRGRVKPIGIFDEGKITLLGEENSFWQNEHDIELRSIYFELIDSKTLTKLSGENDRSYLKPL
jgi:hypothetical protein